MSHRAYSVILPLASLLLLHGLVLLVGVPAAAVVPGNLIKSYHNPQFQAEENSHAASMWKGLVAAAAVDPVSSDRKSLQEQKHIVASEKLVTAEVEEILQTSASSMTCHYAQNFLQRYFNSDTTTRTAAVGQETVTLESTEGSRSGNSNTNCDQNRELVYRHTKEYLASDQILKQTQEPKDADDVAATTDGMVHKVPDMPPFSCTACVASYCQDHDWCLTCCYQGCGYAAFCHVCP